MRMSSSTIGVLQQIRSLRSVAICFAIASFVSGCAIGSEGDSRAQIRDQFERIQPPAGSEFVDCRDVQVFSFASERDSLMVGCFEVGPSRDSILLDSLIGEAARATETTFQSDWSCEMIAADVAYCMATMQGGGGSHADLKALVSYSTNSLGDEFPSSWPDGADVGFAMVPRQ